MDATSTPVIGGLIMLGRYLHALTTPTVDVYSIFTYITFFLLFIACYGWGWCNWCCARTLKCRWTNSCIHKCICSCISSVSNITMISISGSYTQFGFTFRPPIPNYDVLQETCETIDSATLKPARKLKWNITPEVSEHIQLAKEKTDKCAWILPCYYIHCTGPYKHINFRLIKDTDLQMFTFTDFGKNFPKSVNLSPDAFIQSAIQLAYYKWAQK